MLAILAAYLSHRFLTAVAGPPPGHSTGDASDTTILNGLVRDIINLSTSVASIAPDWTPWWSPTHPVRANHRSSITRQVAMAAHVEAGLKSLGLYANSDEAVLHQLSMAMPPGEFDGHRSVVPAPDHLLLHGLSKKLVTAVMFMIPKVQRESAEMSLRDCLRAAQMRRTRLYNLQSGKMYAPSISEWAAIVTVAPIAFARVLQRPLDPPMSAPLEVSMSLLRQLSGLVAYVYHFPRVELDGVACCRERKMFGGLKAKVNRFLEASQESFLRRDCAVLQTALDVPNLHRLRELSVVLETELGHAGHCMELALESAHQPMKRAIQKGNGHDDAGRAMRRMQQMELLSRIGSGAAHFNIPDSWMSHPGVVSAMRCSTALHSTVPSAWTTDGSTVDPGLLPPAATALASQFLPVNASCLWRRRATRGSGRSISPGDTICVLTSGGAGRLCVNVAASRRGHVEEVRFFLLVGIFEGTAGANAIVSPYARAGNGSVFRRVLDRYQFLKLGTTVRRALALHCCGDDCVPSKSAYRVEHNQDNSWYVLGRREGYPSRSG